MDFSEFWLLWPQKRSKADARKAWEKVPPLLHEEVMTGLRRQMTECARFRSFTPLAATWLRGERWGDDPVAESDPRRGDKAGHRYGSTHTGTCQFKYQGRTCPLPGNLQEPGDERWLCKWHILDQNRQSGPGQHAHFDLFSKPGIAEEWVEMNYSQLVGRPESDSKRRIGESLSAYRRRMIDACAVILPRLAPLLEARYAAEDLAAMKEF